MRLSEAQCKAAHHFEGPCMVLAGPGSGKTFTIVNRIKYLIEKCKVRPEEILVITFTRYASCEMKSRFDHLMGRGGYPVTFGTFHGVYFGILRWAYGFTTENIFTEEDKYRLIREILSDPQFDLGLEVTDEKEYIKDLVNEISVVKNSGVDISRYKSKEHGKVIKRVFERYETERKKLRKVDFDDMLTLCYQLFKTYPDALKQWQAKFRYILVDEFQDVNKLQYDVLRMLALPENNLFVVGDDDQSIYAFRGAKPEIMLGFQKDYPNAEKVILNTNYRSTRNIVNGAKRVIGHNQMRYEKNLKATHEKGEPVHVQEVKDPMEESLYIMKKIEDLRKEGKTYKDICILYRSVIDARTMAETLMQYRVPFHMKEYLNNIYDHFTARNLKSYLSLATGKRDRKYFLDIANCPKRYLSRESMETSQISFEQLLNFYCDKDWMQERIIQMEWDIKSMKDKTPAKAIHFVRKQIGYDCYVREYAAAKNMNKEELLEVLDEIEERAENFETIEEWLTYTEEYGERLKEQAAKKDPNEDAITLMTMHGSKGLEFDTVFLIGANEGAIPYKKAKTKEEIEEERRMFYVAMTRAQKKLTICYPKIKNGKEQSPSRFVEELFVVS